MYGVLIGFAIIGTVILAGYLVELSGVLGPEARTVLTRTSFFVATPCLLFSELAHADIGSLLTGYLAVSFLACAIAFLLFLLVSRLFFRAPLADTIVGAGAASFVNSNNIGLPVAAYVLGGTEFAIPVLLMQVVALNPVLLTILDVQTQGRTSLGRVLLQPVKNPMIVGSLLGVALGALRLPIPDEVFRPFELIGGAAIPLVLLSFGMSLRGERPLRPGTGRKAVLTASAIKVLVMPAVAYVFGSFVFGLSEHELYAVVICSALPTAQNIYNFAARYNRGVTVARDTVLVTTIASIGSLLLIAWLLSG